MILFATEYYPPFAPGGAEWSNAAWAAALARRGHRVDVVTPNYGASPREERDGVRVIRVRFPCGSIPGSERPAGLCIAIRPSTSTSPGRSGVSHVRAEPG